MALLDVAVELLVVPRAHGVDEAPVVRGLDTGWRQGVAAALPAGGCRATRARPLFLASAQIALPVPAVAVAEEPAFRPAEQVPAALPALRVRGRPPRGEP